MVVLQISFNVQTAKHVQSTAEGWAVLIGYSGTNFAELGIYITLFFLTPLMEELIYRGLLQHAFFKHSRFGLDLLLPSILFALPHFSSLPSLLDIFVFTTFGIIFAGLTRYTKSIYPSYAVHVINNIFATLPFLLTFYIGCGKILARALGMIVFQFINEFQEVNEYDTIKMVCWRKRKTL